MKPHDPHDLWYYFLHFTNRENYTTAVIKKLCEETHNGTQHISMGPGFSSGLWLCACALTSQFLPNFSEAKLK